jgi:hypothetical protein
VARGWGKPQQAIEMSVEQSPQMLMPELAAIWLRAGTRLNSGRELEHTDADSKSVTHHINKTPIAICREDRLRASRNSPLLG